MDYCLQKLLPSLTTPYPMVENSSALPWGVGFGCSPSFGNTQCFWKPKVKYELTFSLALGRSCLFSSSAEYIILCFCSKKKKKCYDLTMEMCHRQKHTGVIHGAFHYAWDQKIPRIQLRMMKDRGTPGLQERQKRPSKSYQEIHGNNQSHSQRS